MIPKELRLAMDEWERTGKVPDLYAFADAWDETEGRLFDSHGAVMDLRKRLEEAEKWIRLVTTDDALAQTKDNTCPACGDAMRFTRCCPQCGLQEAP